MFKYIVEQLYKFELRLPDPNKLQFYNGTSIIRLTLIISILQILEPNIYNLQLSYN